MPSTYSPSLRLELIGNGEQASNWGNTTNTNLGTLLEQAITGVGAVVMTDADRTLTSGNGVSDEARNAVLTLTSSGSLTATRNLIVPTANKFYAVRNATSGSQTVTVKTSAGTGVGLANGYTQLMYCDGTNVVPATLPFNSTTGNIVVSGNISVVGAVTVGGATTMNGDATIAKNTPAFELNKTASNQNNLILGKTNGSLRWIIIPGNSETETGGNAGSNFGINNYNDSGAYIETPFVINRANGLTTLKSLSVTGAVYSDSFRFRSDGAQDTGIDWESDGVLKFLNNNVKTGSINASGNLSVIGNISTTSNLLSVGSGATANIQFQQWNNSIVGQYYLNTDGTAGFNDTTNLKIRWSSDTSGNFYTYSNITMQTATLLSGVYYSPGLISSPASYQTVLRYFHEPSVRAGAQFLIGGATLFEFRDNGNGYAPNTWISLSDKRVKEDQKTIDGALGKLAKLNGVTYKRNDISNIDGSPIVSVGLLAQDVAAVLPEAVEVTGQAPANDPDGPGLMSLNYNGVIALLVNAVKELSAKVDALEKKAAG